MLFKVQFEKKDFTNIKININYKCRYTPKRLLSRLNTWVFVLCISKYMNVHPAAKHSISDIYDI